MKVHKKVAAMHDQVAADPFPLVMIDRERCLATDGVMMVVLPHSEPPEAGFGVRALTPATVEEGKKAASKKDGYFELNPEALDLAPRLPHGVTLDETVKKAIGKCDLEEDCTVVAFDLDRLVQLAKVLYAGEPGHKRKVVKLFISGDPEAVIRIKTSIADQEAVAYLAPCRK